MGAAAFQVMEEHMICDMRLCIPTHAYKVCKEVYESV